MRTITEATRLAELAVASVTSGYPEPVDATTVLVLNKNGTYSVLDNGEEIVCKTAAEASRIIVENLTTPYNNE